MKVALKKLPLKFANAPTVYLRIGTAIVLLAYVAFLTIRPIQAQYRELAVRTISLEDRQPNPWVNEVFKDNILLNLAYLRGSVKGVSIAWNEALKPFTYTFSLKPQEVFAFHEDTLPEYASNLVKTTNAHFNWSEGFKSDGYLVGDGVCHLASLFYWAAKGAELEARAPVNHDFAAIPEIPREYGVSIFYSPNSKAANEQQNLYIKNTRKKPIFFQIAYNGKDLKVSVSERIVN